ncbi:hypothetical protein SAMN05443246_2925 [Paenibacillus sp. GP183]|jgi:hypothetical protein|nr:hypothetical protein SAMN05443246_2925 [Paenibacillus sp. GP183]
MGWDEKRATTQPVQDINSLREAARRMSELNQKYPRDIVDLAVRNGIKICTFRKRCEKGWDYMNAATIPPSKANGPMRLKELYGENGHYKDMINLVFAEKKMKS